MFWDNTIWVNLNPLKFWSFFNLVDCFFLAPSACVYDSLVVNFYGGHIAAASPAFFKDCAYYGACFQVNKQIK